MKDSKGNKAICLSCEFFPCEWIMEQVRLYEAPSIVWAGACEQWQEDREEAKE